MIKLRHTILSVYALMLGSLVIAQCGGPRTGVTGPIHSSGARTTDGGIARSSDASVQPTAQRVEDQLVVLPQAADFRLIETQGQDVYGTFGSLRVARVSNQWQIADDRFASRIVLATHAPGGWVFISADGAVARSDTFLGPLRRLGNIPQTISRVGGSHGQAAVCDDGGTLWMTDGNVDIHPVSSIPAGSRVRAVAFANGQFGAVILSEGELLVTHDSGAHWAPITSSNIATIELHAERDRLWVSTTNGRFLISPNDTLTPLTASTTEPERELREIIGEETVFHRAIIERYPAMIPQVFDYVYPLTNGRVVVRENDHLVMFDQTTGRAVGQTSWGDECGYLRIWGTVGVFECDGVAKLWDGEHEATTYQLPDGARTVGTVVWSKDGEHALFRGRCQSSELEDAEDPEGSVRKVCVLSRRGGDWVEHTVPESIDSIESAIGNRALLALRNEDYETRYVVLNVDSGQVQNIYFAPHIDDPGQRLEDPVLLPDGIVFSVRRQSGGSPVMLALGNESQTLLAQGLPPRTRDFLFVNRTTGYAVGENLAHVYSTHDGGASWQQLAVSVNGSAEAVRSTGRLRCLGAMCSIDSRILIAPRATREATQTTSLPITSDVVAASTRDYGRFRVFELPTGRLSCTVASRDTPERPRNRPRNHPPTTPRGDQTRPRESPIARRLPAPGSGVIRVQISNSEYDAWIDIQTHPPSAKLYWSEVNSTGSAATLHATTETPLPSRFVVFDEELLQVRLQAVRQNIAVVDLCVRELDQCDTLVGFDRRGLRLVEQRQTLARNLDATVTTRGVVAQNEREAWVYLSAESDRAAIEQLVSITDDGQQQIRRTLSLDTVGLQGAVRGVGTHHGEVGLVVGNYWGQSRIQFFSGANNSPGLFLANPSSSTVQACSQSTASDVASVWVPGNSGWLEYVSTPVSVDSTALLELSSEGLCVRSIASWSSFGQLSRSSRRFRGRYSYYDDAYGDRGRTCSDATRGRGRRRRQDSGARTMRCEEYSFSARVSGQTGIDGMQYRSGSRSALGCAAD